jgi:YfiH family protein
VAVVGTIRAAWSRAGHGDLRPTTDGGVRLGRFADSVTGPDAGRLRWLHQVHGATVRVIDAATVPVIDAADPPTPVENGDALVTAEPSARLAMVTADCASIALGSREGVFAAVHAGWRGLVAGVIEAAAETMRGLGASEVVGALGPTIHAECYEFGTDQLEVVAARLGDGVRSTTSHGRPALDLPAAVAAAWERAGVAGTAGVDACTACSGGYFSHRARRETERQALVVWSAGAR